MKRKIICLFHSYCLIINYLIFISENDRRPQLYCERENCPDELFHPPEDCNVNSTLAFTLQVFVRVSPFRTKSFQLGLVFTYNFWL